MNFARLVEIAADLHCFSPGILAAGEDIDQVRLQLSRWVQSGRIIRIHKGWYSLATPYRRIALDKHVIACTIRPGTYVSLQSALAYHGLIPEYVPETTCVTTGRPLLIESPVGRIRYHHLKGEAFWGYTEEQQGSQTAFVARPEKALLDLIYLTPGGASRGYIAELRLQGLEELDLDLIEEMTQKFGSAKLKRVPAVLAALRKPAEGRPR
jgi:predicted transcriptional regulator of viral defense system